MKKVTQRIISLVICVLMLFGTAPLNGIVELDFSKLNVFSGNRYSSKMPIFRVNGRDGFAELMFLPPEDGSGTLRYMTAASNGVQAPAMEEHFHGGKESCLYFKRATAEIRDAVLSGKKALLDIDDALFGVVIMSSLLESAKSGKAICF